MTEPVITINGRQLVEGQAMAVRAAINSFYAEMQTPMALGSDEHGIRMTEAYRDRLEEVIRLMAADRLPERLAIDDDRGAQERVLGGMHRQRMNRILQLAGIAPEQATQRQSDLASTYAGSGLAVDEAAVRLQRAMEQK